jgi:hypothetical protein
VLLMLLRILAWLVQGVRRRSSIHISVPVFVFSHH